MFGDYHEANDSFVLAPDIYEGTPIHGPDSSWMATQNASGRVSKYTSNLSFLVIPVRNSSTVTDCLCFQ